MNGCWDEVLSQPLLFYNAAQAAAEVNPSLFDLRLRADEARFNS